MVDFCDLIRAARECRRPSNHSAAPCKRLRVVVGPCLWRWPARSASRACGQTDGRSVGAVLRAGASGQGFEVLRGGNSVGRNHPGQAARSIRPPESTPLPWREHLETQISNSEAQSSKIEAQPSSLETQYAKPEARHKDTQMDPKGTLWGDPVGVCGFCKAWPKRWLGFVV